MVIKIDVDDRDLKIIKDELSMLVYECEHYDAVNKSLKQKSLTEKEMAAYNGLNVVDYRKFCHRNHVLKKLFKSIVNATNKQ